MISFVYLYAIVSVAMRLLSKWLSVSYLTQEFFVEKGEAQNGVNVTKQSL